MRKIGTPPSAGYTVAPPRTVDGRVTYGDSGEPAPNLRVTAMDADLFFDDKLGEDETDADGRFHIEYKVADFRDLFERAPDIYLIVRDASGRVLTTTRDAVIRDAGPSQEILVQLPGSGPRPKAPAVVVGGVPVNRIAFARLEPEELLHLAARAMQGGAETEDRETEARLVRLSPELSLARLRQELCFTPLVDFLRDAVRAKGWPREVSLRLEEILIGYRADAAYDTYMCPNFTITYDVTGSDAVPTADTTSNITMPGTGAVVGATVGGNGVPDYIEKLCFWLENALATYTNPPFDMRNPASSGRIPVSVTGTSAGFAGGGSMTIGRNLNDDLLAAVPTHELMHLIQELYRTNGTGSWDPGMTEGGAVLGEDVVFDTHNRYIVQATQSGTLAAPNISLNDSGARYYLALFLKYITEQQSSRISAGDEPAIGVETYRALLERCDLSGYASAAVAQAINDLPWYQSFYEFGYLDPARLDETSSETLLGNFWLACYLKDLGVSIPDRRFDFMEDEDNATWDEIFQGANSVGTLGSVALTSTNTLNVGGNITLSSGAGGSVSPFAARFFKVNVNAAVDTLRVDFTAGSGFTRPIVEIALIEPGGVVRDVLRSDRTTWSRTIASLRGATRLDHVMIIVAGTDVGGPFTLSAREVSAAPDVMVTRWHHQLGTGYEIDSFGWAWTWISPDIWVDNDNDGTADSEVFFSQDNKLFVRLHNQGLAAAAGVSVQFWYQNAAGGLSDAAWLPVEDVNGVVQTLTGLAVPAGGEVSGFVNWAPVPQGTSHHFCVRAVVTSPGDPNTDNKRVLSNFGNVQAAGPYIDLSLIRRMLRERLWIHVIPRANGRWFISAADLAKAQATQAKEGTEVLDVFRLRKRAKLEVHVHDDRAEITPALAVRHLCMPGHDQSRRETSPDAFGHYPTDPRALPPGLEGVPMITIAHVVNGRPVGGFTWAIRE